MFSKPNKPANTSSRPEPADAARKPIAMSLIAENVSVDGDIASDGDIQLDGAVHGDLKVAHLSIGETGQVEGAITADAVEIRGRVAGAISARTVRLFATARVDGDITHSQLSIDAGAHFAGRSARLGEPQQEQLSLSMAAE
ncbi:polymer-forming cytoskeletal protein [Phenylobacterium sp.]|jgi:cytoskeletal protein CcmA (bactofilin family)|uniref:bactofilin family protein n=1 Tax=Phenylobacterium sp. TaxID=1871053 RepID=UPI002E326750|nr:polymer-forming cytoskeletal protein [Phenylobacterium sp.]HEX3366577.1 polymer-forming cytoskeletal protein [Phenylobacterium sp.]